MSDGLQNKGFTQALVLSALSLSSPGCVKILDADGRVTNVNDDGLRLLELDSLEHIRNLYWPGLWPEALRPMVASALEGARKRGVASFTALCPTAKGVEKWWDVNVAAIPSAEGQFCVISRDVTERQRSDARMDSAQEMAQMALTGSGAVGLWDWMVESDLLHGDANFAHLYGLDAARTAAGLTEHDYQEFVVADDLAALRAKIRAVFERGEDFLVEYRLAIPGQPLRWVECRGKLLGGRDGEPHRFSGTAIDITERRIERQRVGALLELGDQLRDVESVVDTISAASSILGRELKVDRVGYATVNRAQGSFTIERDWTAPDVPSLVGVHPLAGVVNTLNRLSSDEIMSISDVPATDWLGDDRDAYERFGARALINVPLVIRQGLSAVLFVHVRHSRTWTEGEMAFAHGVADRAYATIAQLEAEEQRNVLNLELSHRMKNMLAMVQAIANQTLKGVDDREAVSALDQRLLALGTAHDVLLQDHWSSAMVGDVVDRVLNTLGLADRVRVQGSSVSFGPRATLALSLLLHELSTNAMKYGSLSVDQGRVDLDWAVEGLGEEASFLMHWREAGGPAVAEPSRKGFGSRLIRMGLLGTGGTTTRYLPSGFEAKFSVPLNRANAE